MLATGTAATGTAGATGATRSAGTTRSTGTACVAGRTTRTRGASLAGRAGMMRRARARLVTARIVAAALVDIRAGRTRGLDARRFGGEAFRQRQQLGLDPGQPLDVAQIGPLVIGAEADRHARCAGARGAADAVDILLGHVGQLEIDDVADARDVDAARGDVGRDQDLRLARLELAERALALRLALVAMDRVRRRCRYGPAASRRGRRRAWCG